LRAIAGLLALVACLWLPAQALDEQVAMWEPIPDAVWESMQGVSWHGSFEGAKCAEPETCACPARDDLVLLTVPYRDFEGEARTGQLIIARDAAQDLADIFTEIFDSGQFRIAGMELVDAYGGSDDASMAANNTSAFNCRLTTGGTRLSSHAFGTAIDINPVQNPYVKGETTLPPAGDAFDEETERSAGHMGVIVAGDVVTTAFASRGWTWGGDWTSLKDYQHFSSDGR
jgi:hypothetical protein